MEGVVGQGEAISALEGFLARAAAGACAAVIEGEPGTGKTTLWAATADAARRSRLVLAARAVEAEATLASTGIADLIEPVGERLFATLPAPQRVALEAALLLRDPEVPPDPRALGAALLTLLRELSAEAPVLVAVDDLQWLDAMSAGALAFAARRLRAEPVGLLFARRVGHGHVELDDVPAPAPPIRIRPTRLPVAGLGELIDARLGARYPVGTMRRIHEVSDGNPFYALELAAALQRRRATIGPADPLPVPESLAELVGERIAALDDGTRRALLAASLLGAPTSSVVVEATGCDVEKAVAAGLVRRVDGRIQFTHPLLATAVTAQAALATKQDMHRRLAGVVHDVEERALHLALATTQADEDVAAEVATAAERAFVRGAVGAAAAFAEHALRLTPALHGDRAARCALAGKLQLGAGAQQRGVELLEEAIAELAPGPHRARLLFELADGIKHDVARGRPLLDQAVAESGDDLATKARALGLRATLDGVIALENLPRAADEASEAVRLAEAAADPTITALNLVSLAWTRVMLGDSPEAIAERVERDAGDVLPFWWTPRRAVHLWLIRRGQGFRAREPLIEMRRRALETGQEEIVSVADYHLADLEILAGNWADADVYANELAAFADHVPPSRPVAASVVGLLAALRGELDEAWGLAERGLDEAVAFGSVMYAIQNAAVLALVAVSRGEWRVAIELTQDPWDRARRAGLANPGIIPFLPDRIEAYVRVGELEAAAELLEWLEREADRQDHPWARIVGGRCAGLVAAAEGRIADAVAAFDAALAVSEIGVLPYERARTLLARGTALRRARQKRGARESLGAAAAVFDDLGARIFAEQARDELTRVGGRPAASASLTPAQRQVADLAAAGRRNKEIASTLVVSEHTVDSHLRQVYAKLDVRSRVELAAKLAALDEIAST